MIATLAGPRAGLDAHFCLLVTWTLVHFVWQGCLLALALAVAGRVLRGASANLRYSAGLATLAAMAVCLPLTLALIDPAPLDQPGTSAMRLDPSDAMLLSVDPLGREPATLGSPVERPIGPAPAADSLVRPHGWRVAWKRVSSWALSLLSRASTYATVAYAVGLAAMLARVVLGLAIGRRLRRQAIEISTGPTFEFVRRQAERLALRAIPSIAWCGRVAVPVVVGIVRPMILLPAALASGLTERQLELVLLHELAHIRRYDPIVNLLQRFVEAIGFFHPAVWWVSRQVSLERELACDDAVLRAGCQGPVYADALVRVAELCAALVHGETLAAGSLAAIGRGKQQLRRRIMRLVDADRPAAIRPHAPAAAIAVLLSAGLLLALAAWRSPALAEDTKTPGAVQEKTATPAAAAPDDDPEDAALAGQTIVEICVTGNDQRATAAILAAISTRVDRPLDPSALEKDARVLAQKKWFHDVRAIREPLDGGVRITFEVVERPTLLYVKYLGNAKVRDKRLAKETELKKGSSIDPAAVEAGRRKIEEFYRSRGFKDAKVEIVEGTRPGDRGAIFMINEGEREQLVKATFAGGAITSGERLRTQIESKTRAAAGVRLQAKIDEFEIVSDEACVRFDGVDVTPLHAPLVLRLFKSLQGGQKIEKDIEMLTQHYRNLGFFRVKISRQVTMGEESQRPKRTLTINEGPHYRVVAIRFDGNSQFTSEELGEATVLKAGQFYLRRDVDQGLAKMKGLYHDAGYAAAAIEPELEVDEDAATVTVVYRIVEGEKSPPPEDTPEP